MMFLPTLNKLRRRILAIALASCLMLSCLMGLQQPSFAASALYTQPENPGPERPLTPRTSSYKPLTPEEKIDRAYDLREGVGMEEEFFQEEVQEGNNPENMPAPYKRVTGAEGQKVPETSPLEEIVGKVREAIGD
ncbi:MAG: hypothetical protein ACFB4I_17625 [Cyanophyceae cyanobacterium]